MSDAGQSRASQTLDQQQEGILRNALSTFLVQFDRDLERRYGAHAHQRARDLINRSVYLLMGLYLLVVLPVIVLVKTPEMAAWRSYGVYPIAAALIGLWCCTRLSWLRPHAIGIMYLALGLSLSGTVLGSIRFNGSFPGQISSFETIYLLIIGFSILRLPPRQTLVACTIAAVVAFAISLLMGLALPLLLVSLSFGIPLIICTLNGYILDISARRNFANNLLLAHESEQLKHWREQAEKDTHRQQQLNTFMEQIAGNLTPTQLLERVLGYLVQQVNAQVGAAYTLEENTLVRQAGWALNDAAQTRSTLPAGEGLLGAALNQRLLMQQHHVPENYLDLETGQGKRPPGAVLLWPLIQGDHPLGIIEIANTQGFDQEQQTLISELHRPLAFALQSAQRRQQFLDQTASANA
ncbi:histidine kinase [Alcanivorax sp. HI0083]|uniref:GAF domain-containing protein n=1 Tax=unclassified Alcanivorax TaxID=2638842 RepID=UPI0007B8F9D1|nr:MULTISPECIES: GAF domain-containing protein [unclassified Alcanivorax]KZY36263.1 histidine kinase [Alcanivorax sp. HI0044]KZZ27292.1 histidine kinase [Alcanivorax sp. HI0083]